MATLRDGSWYTRPNVRSVKQYHVALSDLGGMYPACNPKNMLLDDLTAVPAGGVTPTHRCQRPGCRTRWP